MPFCTMKPKSSASGFNGLSGAPDIGEIETTGESCDFCSITGEEAGDDQSQESQELLAADVALLGVAGPESEIVDVEEVVE